MIEREIKSMMMGLSTLWVALMLIQIGHVHTQFAEIMKVNDNTTLKSLRSGVLLVEGDIITDTANSFDASRARKWTDGVVPYIIREGEEDKLGSVVAAAAAEYVKHTCIKWRKYPNQEAIQSAGVKNYVEFFATGGGCYSYVGMSSRIPQPISIRYPGCAHRGIVIHEMLHALGFWHEQSRMDRDTAITVAFENIQTGKEGNFKKHVSEYYGEKYDIKSIMQYGPRAFSKNGKPTILSKEGIKNFGQRGGLSPSDIRQINAHYKCPNNPAPGPQPTSEPGPRPTSAPGPRPPPGPIKADCGKPEIPMADMAYSNGTRVIGGKDANRGSWPWQILLLYKGRQMCGGSIISERWVVTAAHCVYGRTFPGSNYAIRAGEHDTRRSEGSEQTVTVKNVIAHPSYNPRTIDNDIALLELSTPVKFNEWVKPVCLPSEDVEGKTNQFCYITGWGKIEHPGSMHHTLQQGKLKVPSKQTCNAKNRGMITNSMICGGDGGVTQLSGCHGDSGGPFVCNIKGRWELHGAVSWGSGTCESRRLYTVFSKVLTNIRWILSKTGQGAKPVDGNWGRWAPWSTCSESCGGGRQVRRRECNNPSPQNGGKNCPGLGSESRNCNTQRCPTECGKPTFPATKSTDRVIGGEDAVRGSWPWQILLMYRGRPSCGGTLVRKNWVVTAAHCVSGRENQATSFTVRVGENDRTRQEGSEKDMKVKRIVKHPGYNRPQRLSNDIALLELSEEVTYNDFIKPACLPEQEVPEGTFCYITGFGKIKHPGSMHTKLQQGRLQVPSNTKCNSLNFPNTGLRVDDTMICGGDGGVTKLSGCHGDSGGPFVCKVNGRWELHGAVSWGSGRCDSTQTYTVFSRVMKNLNWIKANVGTVTPPSPLPPKPKPTGSPATTPFPGVNCGGHRAPSCKQCSQGNGAAWCNGECSWCANLNQCHAKGDQCRAPPVTAAPPVTSAPPSRCSVTFYQHSNYGGLSNTYSQSSARLVRDNDMSSFRLSSGCCVTIYDYSEYRGTNQKQCKGTAWVGSSWNDRASSFKLYRDGNPPPSSPKPTRPPGPIPSQCSVTFYQHSLYRGLSHTYAQSSATVMRDNDMSSLKLSSGCCVTIYDYSGYRGRNQQFCASSLFVGPSWNDKTSSFKLSRKDGSGSAGCQMTDTIFAYRNARTPTGNTFKVSSWQQCAAKCASDTRCFAWSWMNEKYARWGRLKCKLKSEFFVKGKRAQKNVVSGTKACTGGTTAPPPPVTAVPKPTQPPTQPPSPRPPNGQCGVQAHITGKIVGGKNAEPGEWPWMVGLYGAGTAVPGRAPFCGGTLIRDNVVVTAAHCLRSTSSSSYEVRIGDHNLGRTAIGPLEEAVGLSKIYKHENYSPRTSQNDIALLILNKKVKLGGQVQAACLPTKPPTKDATCYATGWGILKEGGRTQPQILQEVQLPLISQSDCRRGDANGNRVTEDMICAGYFEGGKDSCQGDSGGPLVCKIPGTDQMELRGVTSWGRGCARRNKPGVYARVSYFVRWIDSKLLQHDMETVERKVNAIEALLKTLKS